MGSGRVVYRWRLKLSVGSFLGLVGVSGDLAATNSCSSGFKQTLSIYKELAEAAIDIYPKNQFLQASKSLMGQMKSCANRLPDSWHQDFLNLQAIHSGKIGVLLPMEKIHRRKSLAFITGIHASFVNDKEYIKKIFFLDSSGKDTSYKQKVADLLLNHRVGVIIGGGTPWESQQLIKFAGPTGVPVLLLTHPKKNRGNSKNVFSVSPDGRRQVRGLVRHIVNEKYSRLGILQPKKNADSRLNQELRMYLEKYGVEIFRPSYTHGSYQSVKAAVKFLFGIDKEEREEEYLELLAQKKEASEAMGEVFQDRFLALAPLDTVDAIFIPDNFRTVRHLVKILKFLGVKKIPLIGNQQWRSVNLVDPPDSYLEGAVFIDFVGSYRNLPAGIKVPKLNGPNLLPAKDSIILDFQLIGFRSGAIAAQVLKGKKPRHRLHEQIRHLKEKSFRYFPQGKIFSSKNSAQWPGFLFRVERRRIRLYARY